MDQDIAAAYDTLTPEQEELRKSYDSETWALGLSLQLSMLGFRAIGQGRVVQCIHCNGRSTVPENFGPQDVLIDHVRQHPGCRKPIGSVAKQPIDQREQQEIEEKIAQARPFFLSKGIPSDILERAENVTRRRRSGASVIADLMHAICELQRTPQTGDVGTPSTSSIPEENDEEMLGKQVIARDVHNLKKSLSGRNEAHDLLKEVQLCREKHGAKVILAADENQELQILFIQTQHMQQAFKCFPEVLLVDATYRTNRLRMPLFVFVVQDGTGGTQVVAYAFVASEQQHVVSQLLDTFVEENPDSEKTKVVIVDKDFTEINAIRSAFKSTPAIQLCQFHVMKAFRAAAGQLSKSVDERERLMASFAEMTHAPTPSKFEETKTEFERFARPEAIDYFNKNWNSIPDMWVRYLCDREFTGGNNTTNRVESHNGKIKNILTSSSKLHQALHSLLNMANSMRQESRHKINLLKTCEFYSYNRCEDVESLCAKVLTPYACDLVSKEVLKVKQRCLDVRQTSTLEYGVASGNDTVHTVSLEQQSCTCRTFSKMGLLCRHFLAVCIKYSVQPDLEKAVRQRWFKSFQLDFLAMTSQQTTHGEQVRSGDLQVLSLPKPQVADMNRNQRYNYALRTLKALADTLADSRPHVFIERLTFLEDVNATWLRGEEVPTDRLHSTEGDLPADILLEPEEHADDPCAHHVAETDTGEGSANLDLEEPHPPLPEPGQNEVATEDHGLSFSIKLPVVKSRGRPPKRILQRRVKTQEYDRGKPVPFQQLPKESQHKMLLTAITGEKTALMALNGVCCVEEGDIEVRPELLPSSLLDFRVSLPGIKKFFTPDAWLLLSSSIAAKKRDEIWSCACCKQRDDGTLKMICCDQCLEWFHWSCAAVIQKGIKKHWFCPGCRLHS